MRAREREREREREPILSFIEGLFIFTYWINVVLFFIQVKVVGLAELYTTIISVEDRFLTCVYEFQHQQNTGRR